MSYYGLPYNSKNASYHSHIFVNVFNTDFAIIDFQSDDKAGQWEKEYKNVKRAEDSVIMYIEANHVSLIKKMFFLSMNSFWWRWPFQINRDTSMCLQIFIFQITTFASTLSCLWFLDQSSHTLMRMAYYKHPISLMTLDRVSRQFLEIRLLPFIKKCFSDIGKCYISFHFILIICKLLVWQSYLFQNYDVHFSRVTDNTLQIVGVTELHITKLWGASAVALFQGDRMVF